MAKLLVKHGKTHRNKEFHPTIKIQDTGYCTNQVLGIFFRDGVFGGMEGMSHWRTIAPENPVGAFVKHYLEELKRTNHKPVEPY